MSADPTHCVLVLTAIMLLAGGVRADVLYDNGPYDGTTNAWTINYGYAVANAFTAPDGSTAEGVSLITWNSPGDTLVSVDWQISSGNPLSGDPFTVLGSGTAFSTATDIGLNGYSYDLQSNVFTFDPVLLTGGNYWLMLQNAYLGGSASLIFWDQNSGPSAAWESALGDVSLASESNNCSGPCTASESFQILTNIPEPATMGLMLAGVLGTATIRRTRGARGKNLGA